MRFDPMCISSSVHLVRQLEAHLQPTVCTMAMQIIAIMARLTSVVGGFVQLTANDDTGRARSVAAERARHARSAVERGVRLARRPRHRLISLARRPPATPTPHSAPPHRCIVNTTGRPSAPGTGGAATAADQTGPRALCTAPTHNFTTARHLAAMQKINNFQFLKKTRKQRLASCETMAAAQIPMRTMKRKQTQHLFSILLIGLVVRRTEFNMQHDRCTT
uniref:SFRICE_015772 n=1 Tax=Spodoptera frugiperda TaxID=7108 RepID=A0A2H1V5F4_SPOFR